MSNFDDVISKCKAQMEEHSIAVDDALLTAIAKSLGPSIYSLDSLTVASSDPAEMATVHEFITNKLGVEPGLELEGAIEKAVETLGSGNSHKLRPVFYYLLVKELGKESQYAG